MLISKKNINISVNANIFIQKHESTMLEFGEKIEEMLPDILRFIPTGKHQFYLPTSFLKGMILVLDAGGDVYTINCRSKPIKVISHNHPIL